ncbi:hypothetical protein K2X85_06730 [bacterium]|jgi:hypothetical protein|nr:hypothetical protein [bacterium]
MDVSHLKQFILNLALPVRASGGAKVANELEQTAEALSPFASLSMRDFAEFLEKADLYHREGIVPTKAITGGSKRSPALKGDELVKDLAQQIGKILESATDSTQSYESLTDQMASVLKKPTKAIVLLVAKELHIPGTFKTKGDAVAAIAALATDRRYTHERTQF